MFHLKQANSMNTNIILYARFMSWLLTCSNPTSHVFLFCSIYCIDSSYPWLQYVTEDNVILTAEFRDVRYVLAI